MINQDASFAARLIEWQAIGGRHDLPWQQTTDPYRVWLSEIMLQQTQVITVVPYFRRFVARFPTLGDLARAPLGEVMAAWSGLGYYARARNLHACAKVLLGEHDGRFPQEPETIATLPGIGRSTANAIAVFCYGARAPILDGNVKRLLCRHFGVPGLPGTASVERQLWHLAESLLPQRCVANYIQAQMDLGATLCTRSKPDCACCPIAASCVARAEARTDLLPERRPRKTLPERRTRVLLLVDGGRVLLLNRPPTGVWGGLLSLPEVPDRAEPSKYAADALGYAVSRFEQLPPLRHSFTHFHLTLLPLAGDARPLPRVADRAGGCWMGRKELAGAALPAPIRSLLQHFLQPNPGRGGAPTPEPAGGSGRQAIR